MFLKTITLALSLAVAVNGLGPICKTDNCLRGLSRTVAGSTTFPVLADCSAFIGATTFPTRTV
ncbi:hypothetical protein ABW20_dc0100190 [Dactylellina cionopaga]|nr:hypothetical protein ABW20_dc0100190 [Dactylellina cionopaga]